MTRVAFLGLGAMGSRMAAHLCAPGIELVVWNRSPEAADALLKAGARWANTPAEAAEHADVVVSMVRDDDASRQVWCDPDSGALSRMRSGALAIESSTLSLAWVAELANACSSAGVGVLDAPVSGSRPAAQSAQLVYLVGGEANDVATATPLLQRMGSAVQHVGAVGSGTLAKLVTNALLGVHVSVLAELNGLLDGLSVGQNTDAARVLSAVATTPVWAPVDHYLSSVMQNGDDQPQFPVELIEKDFGYVVNANPQAELPMLEAARQVFRRGIDAGLASRNMTAVAKLY